MALYLTFDLGTTALKTALVEDDGSLVAAYTGEYTPRMPSPGFMEMDPQVYWQAVVDGTRQVFARSGAQLSSVAAIGFSSQAQTFIPLDSLGQPLYDAIIWLDCRSREIAGRWQAEWLSVPRFRQVSGYPWIPPELTVFKIAWLSEHVPVTRGTWKYLCLPDYLIYRLTGETVTDAVTARMSGLYDDAAGDWEPRLLAAAGVTAEQLPTVLPPGSVAGTLHSEAAETLGLPAGIPVCTGANDQLVGAIGAGNVQPGIISETTGTALAVIVTTPTRLDDLRMTVGRHAVPGLYYAMAFANTSAILLTWLRSLCGREEEGYDAFLKDVSSIPIGCDGLCVLPHFSGTPPPQGDPAARGAFIGLSLAHTRAHLARGVMEACACLLRECLEPVLVSPDGITHVRSLGGAARNDLWLQMKADLLGLPVERPLCTETASLGSAMLAASATGQFAHLADAAAAWYRPSALFEPDLTRRRLYQEVYDRYLHYSELFYGKEK